VSEPTDNDLVSVDLRLDYKIEVLWPDNRTWVAASGHATRTEIADAIDHCVTMIEGTDVGPDADECECSVKFFAPPRPRHTAIRMWRDLLRPVETGTFLRDIAAALRNPTSEVAEMLASLIVVGAAAEHGDAGLPSSTQDGSD
jgi:hypothetical protein